VNLYRFIDTWKATFGVRRLCQVLGVPQSSYFDWNSQGRRITQGRADREAVLVERIRRFHAASDESYGSPRVHADLVEDGERVSPRRVAGLMARHGIVGLSGREHSTVTTRRDRIEAPFPDLVNRAFHPGAPDVVWYGDITYVWVESRFWYLATVIDAASKKVIGWQLADHMRAGLAVEALRAAIRRRGGLIRTGVIFHSDRGSQYTGYEFQEACHGYGIRQSMGRRGVCFDNAGAESFFATIKRELIDRYFWSSADQLRIGVFSWIETWYNRKRRHSTLGYRTPEQAENSYRQNKQAS